MRTAQPTVEKFKVALARHLAAPTEENKEWLRLAKAIEVVTERRSAFLVSEFKGEGHEKLVRIRFAFAQELYSAAQQTEIAQAFPGKLVSFAEVLWRPCLVCGATALIVGEDCWLHSFDPVSYTDAFTLCLKAPHVTKFASSAEYFQPLST